MLKRLFLIYLTLVVTDASRTWKCDKQQCTKDKTDNPESAVSVQECKLTCLPVGGIWPAPTGTVEVSTDLVTVNPKDVVFTTNVVSEETRKVLTEAQEIFLSRFKEQISENHDLYSLQSININIANEDVTYYATGVDESYEISLSSALTGDKPLKLVSVEITAETFLGARHALETVSQLIVFDDLRERYRMPSSASIKDKPVFPYRGVHVDSARSYFPVSTILQVIDGMAQNKLNSLHWHITDTHSFPYVSEAFPQMSAEGAYSKNKVYSPADIRLIVEYARARGVRVTPELDAPAHVGEGWDALGDNLITCFRWEPWTKYCVEPPCGQFDVTQDRLYDILHTLFLEWGKLFKSDLFHMGGDEVNLNCWKSTPRIVDWMNVHNYTINDQGFIDIWNRYQVKSRDQLKNAQASSKPVLWSSTLTDGGRAPDYLPPDDYIIQIWSQKDAASIRDLISQKYQLIFSNYDELYFDCGAAAWIGGNGLNWCSPYKGWQTVYGHNPYTIAQNLGITVDDGVKAQLIGSEAALWTEQVDENQVLSKYFPRAAALAERLWSNPSGTWEEAQYRMNYHRERLVRNGIQTELLQPEWCYQNDGFCGLGE